MASPLALFMNGMIRDKSEELGMSVHMVLVSDNAVPDVERFHSDSESSSSDSSDDSVASELSEDLDSSEHLKMLRWSASMGDKRSLAKLKAAEDSKVDKSSNNSNNNNNFRRSLHRDKLRWTPSMGDTTSMTMLKKETRWSAGTDETSRISFGGIKPLKKPHRQRSLTLTLPKLKMPESFTKKPLVASAST